MKILIVEDEIFTAMLIYTYLKNFDHQILKIVSTGEAAIKKAIEERPDIIFMDVGLSGNMSGIEAANIILEKYEVPIIFITGYSMDNINKLIKKVKFVRRLTKPFIMEDMINVINSIIEEMS